MSCGTTRDGAIHMQVDRRAAQQPSHLGLGLVRGEVALQEARARHLHAPCTHFVPTRRLWDRARVPCIRGGAYRRHRQEVDGERLDFVLDEDLRPRARRRAELEGAHPGPQQPELLVQLVQLEVGA